jgi:biotin operon repressor
MKKVDVSRGKLEYLIKHWNKLSITTLAQRLKTDEHHISQWAEKLRKDGVPLEKKRVRGRSIFTEVARDYLKGLIIDSPEREKKPSENLFAPKQNG